MMVVSDLLGDVGQEARITDDALRAGVDVMMRVACAVATT